MAASAGFAGAIVADAGAPTLHTVATTAARMVVAVCQRRLPMTRRRTTLQNNSVDSCMEKIRPLFFKDWQTRHRRDEGARRSCGPLQCQTAHTTTQLLRCRFWPNDAFTKQRTLRSIGYHSDEIHQSRCESTTYRPLFSLDLGEWTF